MEVVRSVVLRLALSIVLALSPPAAAWAATAKAVDEPLATLTPAPVPRTTDAPLVVAAGTDAAPGAAGPVEGDPAVVGPVGGGSADDGSVDGAGASTSVGDDLQARLAAAVAGTARVRWTETPGDGAARVLAAVEIVWTGPDGADTARLAIDRLRLAPSAPGSATPSGGRSGAPGPAGAAAEPSAGTAAGPSAGAPSSAAPGAGPLPSAGALAGSGGSPTSSAVPPVTASDSPLPSAETVAGSSVGSPSSAAPTAASAGPSSGARIDVTAEGVRFGVPGDDGAVLLSAERIEATGLAGVAFGPAAAPAVAVAPLVRLAADGVAAAGVSATVGGQPLRLETVRLGALAEGVAARAELRGVRIGPPDGDRLDLAGVDGAALDVRIVAGLAAGGSVETDGDRELPVLADARATGVVRVRDGFATRAERVDAAAVGFRPTAAEPRASLVDRLAIPVTLRGFVLGGVAAERILFEGSSGTVRAEGLGLDRLSAAGFGALSVDRFAVEDPGSRIAGEGLTVGAVEFGGQPGPGSETQLLFGGFRVESLGLKSLAATAGGAPLFALSDAALSLRFPIGSVPTQVQASLGRLDLAAAVLDPEVANVLAAAGLDRLVLSGAVDLSWLDGREAVSLDRGRIAAEGLAEVAVSGVVDGVPRVLLEDWTAHAAEAAPRLAAASLVLTDRGLVAALLARAAALNDLPAAVFKARLIQALPAVLQPIGDPILRGRTVFALASFLNGAGSLHLSTTRRTPVPLAVLRDTLATDPGAVPALVGLEAATR